MPKPRAKPIGTIRIRVNTGRFASSLLYYEDEYLTVTDMADSYTITHKPTGLCFGRFSTLKRAIGACKDCSSCGVDWSQKKPKYSKEEYALVEPIIKRWRTIYYVR